MNLIRNIALGIAGIASLALTACQTTTAAPTAALSCDKCRTVFVKSPSTASGPSGKGLVTLRETGRMACPDCENQAIAWVKTGSITKHSCASCGGQMRHCTSH